MEKFIFILTFFLTLSLENFGQSKPDLEIFYDSVFNTEELSDLNDIKFKKYSATIENNQDLNFNVVQTNWNIIHKKKYQRINLLTLSINNRIFYYEITSPELREDFEGFNVNVLKTKMDTSILQILNKSARESYSTPINLNHLKRLPNRSIFGYACYGSGQMPEEGLEMQVMVEQEDYELLDQWLRSINPIKQAYAFVGFKLLLHQRKIELTQNQSNLMDKIMNMDILLYSCSGCTIWEFVSANSLLSANNVNRFIEQSEE